MPTTFIGIRYQSWECAVHSFTDTLLHQGTLILFEDRDISIPYKSHNDPLGGRAPKLVHNMSRLAGWSYGPLQPNSTKLGAVSCGESMCTGPGTTCSVRYGAGRGDLLEGEIDLGKFVASFVFADVISGRDGRMIVIPRIGLMKQDDRRKFNGIQEL